MNENILKAEDIEEIKDAFEEAELTLKNMKIGIEALKKEVSVTTELIQFLSVALKEASERNRSK